MTDKFKILAEFAKDISFETPDVETFFKTKENISKYNLNIDINSKPLKNKLVEINIVLKFFDTNLDNKRSNIEIYGADFSLFKEYYIDQETNDLYSSFSHFYKNTPAQNNAGNKYPGDLRRKRQRLRRKNRCRGCR